MTDLGLRERKKARTRQVIADAAARLFAQRGYEQVAVSDVAREAEVSEQTVYNYFQTKEQLVTDRDQLVQDELSRLIRTRAPGTTPAAAIREFVLDTVRGDPPHSRRTVARRTRLPGRHQPHRPPVRPGDVRPPGHRPRHRPRRDRHSAARDRTTAGNRASWRLPDHHHRSRTPHPRGPEPEPDRRRTAASHRSGPRRPRRLAYPSYGPAQQKPRDRGCRLPATHLTRPTRAGNKPSRRLITGCAEHPGMRKQLLTDTNSISARNVGTVT